MDGSPLVGSFVLSHRLILPFNLRAGVAVDRFGYERVEPPTQFRLPLILGDPTVGAAVGLLQHPGERVEPIIISEPCLSRPPLASYEDRSRNASFGAVVQLDSELCVSSVSLAAKGISPTSQ